MRSLSLLVLVAACATPEPATPAYQPPAPSWEKPKVVIVTGPDGIKAREDKIHAACEERRSKWTEERALLEMQLEQLKKSPEERGCKPIVSQTVTKTPHGEIRQGVTPRWDCNGTIVDRPQSGEEMTVRTKIATLNDLIANCERERIR